MDTKKIVLALFISILLPIIIHKAARTFINTGLIAQEVANNSTLNMPSKAEGMRIEKEVGDFLNQQSNNPVSGQERLRFFKEIDIRKKKLMDQQHQEIEDYQNEYGRRINNGINQAFTNNLLMFGIPAGVACVVIGLFVSADAICSGLIVGGCLILLDLCVVFWTAMPMWLMILVLLVLLIIMYFGCQNLFVGKKMTTEKATINAAPNVPKNDDSDLSWEKTVYYILAGLYVLSFFLPSAKFSIGMDSGYRPDAPQLGISAFLIALMPLTPFFIIAIGNISMVGAIIKPNNFFKWGLAAQSFFLLTVTTWSYFVRNPVYNDEIEYPLLFGYYVWAISQIGMCLLLWIKDAKAKRTIFSWWFSLGLVAYFFVVGILSMAHMNAVKNSYIARTNKEMEGFRLERKKQEIEKVAAYQQQLQCEDSERKKIDNSSAESLRKTLIGTKWMLDTFSFKGPVDFYADGTYSTYNVYARDNPGRYHGRWEVTGVGSLRLINGDDSKGIQLVFNSTSGEFRGEHEDGDFWGRLGGYVRGQIQCNN